MIKIFQKILNGESKIFATTFLAAGFVLNASCKEAYAGPPCPPTYPPAYTYICRDSGGTLQIQANEEVISCSEEDVIDDKFIGCYDTNGDCEKEKFNRKIDKVRCLIRFSDGAFTSRICDMTYYYPKGGNCDPETEV